MERLAAYVAPAHFSGELTRQLSAHTREKIGVTIEKDFTQLPPKELADRLREYVQH